jgi:hypothetical protein
MNFATLGIGVNQFADGLQRGMSLRENIDKRIKQKQLDQASSDAFDAAKQAQQADITAGAEAKPLMDYYMKVAAPKVRDAYLQNGDIQTAKVWGDWIKSDGVQKGMASWASAVRSAQQGDHAGFLKNYLDAYNNSGYYDDGLQAVGSKTLTGDNGEATGFEITFKDKKGKETTQRFDDMEQIYTAGLMLMSPEKVFEQGMNQLNAAQAIRVKEAERKQKLQDNITLEGVKQGGRYQLEGYKSDLGMNRDNNKATNQIKVNEANVAAGGASSNDPVVKAKSLAEALVKNAGWTEQQVSSAYPMLLGIYRKPASPQDEVRQAVTVLSQTNPKWDRMKDEDQKLAVQNFVVQMRDITNNLNQQKSDQGARHTAAPQGGHGRGLPMWGPDGKYFINK